MADDNTLQILAQIRDELRQSTEANVKLQTQYLEMYQQFHEEGMVAWKRERTSFRTQWTIALILVFVVSLLSNLTAEWIRSAFSQ